jgi:Zn-dependent protease
MLGCSSAGTTCSTALLDTLIQLDLAGLETEPVPVLTVIVAAITDSCTHFHVVFHVVVTMYCTVLIHKLMYRMAHPLQSGALAHRCGSSSIMLT